MKKPLKVFLKYLEYMNRGEKHKKKGDYFLAIKYYTNAIKKSFTMPSFDRWWLWLAYFNRGVAYAYKGDYKKPIKDWKKVPPDDEIDAKVNFKIANQMLKRRLYEAENGS